MSRHTPADTAGRTSKQAYLCAQVHWRGAVICHAYAWPLIAAHISKGIVMQSTQHAGDDYAKMIQGDPGIEDIYYWGPDGPRVSTRGRTGAFSICPHPDLKGQWVW